MITEWGWWKVCVCVCGESGVQHNLHLGYQGANDLATASSKLQLKTEFLW